LGQLSEATINKTMRNGVNIDLRYTNLCQGENTKPLAEDLPIIAGSAKEIFGEDTY